VLAVCVGTALPDDKPSSARGCLAFSHTPISSASPA
jgi:hypothetical protein